MERSILAFYRSISDCFLVCWISGSGLGVVGV